MRHQNLNAFLNEDNRQGVYIFTSDSCELCEQFQKDLSMYDTSSFVAVEVMGDEELILNEMFGINQFPYTAVFIENYVKFVKKGVLFQKQMNELFDFLKCNNMKITHAKTLITQLVPVVLESPFRGDSRTNTEYAKLAIADSISRGESPIAFHLLYSDIYDINNPQHNLIVKRLKEAWSIQPKKTVVYTDEGVSEGMLDGITDAASRGVEVEFRKLYEN